jgi:hypothetical protein
MDATTALAIYRAEKDKALRERRVSHVQLMAEAQEAFRKMLADAQLARKGGRPKGSTNAASAAPAASVVTTQSVAVNTSKLVFKPTKAAPSKAPEKVTTAVEASSSKTRPAARKAAAVKVAAPKVEKRPAEKRTAEKPNSEKRRASAKAKPAAKAAKRTASASAPARKGSAKKAAAPRKQAAAQERKPKSRKR